MSFHEVPTLLEHFPPSTDCCVIEFKVVPTGTY
uniref:Uncharacterized protein n=1 Tax=Lepeophtheirus salmonis TaxID=72036 RepID=A0A0K2TXY9_LEPSM